MANSFHEANRTLVLRLGHVAPIRAVSGEDVISHVTYTILSPECAVMAPSSRYYLTVQSGRSRTRPCGR
jgi:hypothetical protein